MIDLTSEINLKRSKKCLRVKTRSWGRSYDTTRVSGTEDSRKRSHHVKCPKILCESLVVFLSLFSIVLYTIYPIYFILCLFRISLSYLLLIFILQSSIYFSVFYRSVFENQNYDSWHSLYEFSYLFLTFLCLSIYYIVHLYLVLSHHYNCRFFILTSILVV